MKIKEIIDKLNNTINNGYDLDLSTDMAIKLHEIKKELEAEVERMEADKDRLDFWVKYNYAITCVSDKLLKYEFYDGKKKFFDDNVKGVLGQAMKGDK